MAGIQMKEGEVTSTIYGLIKDQRYSETIEVLNNIIQTYDKSRQALSLLGYCYYQLQNFVNAADCYEQLTLLNPDVDEYRLYYAQSLYKAGLYEEAMKVSCQIDNPAYRPKIVKLQAGIRFGQEDFTGAKSLVDESPADDPDTLVNVGCLLFKEGHHEAALQKFVHAQQVGGETPSLSCNIALCHYMMKQFKQALDSVSGIISKGISEHSELAVGMNTEGIDVRSVGNTLTLHESALIEAFNLQAAIEFQLKHYDLARVALTDMPPRSEEELDPVTLHNNALINMETNPTEGLQKLQYLLQQDSFPPETFSNLLLLYIKYEILDISAIVLANLCVSYIMTSQNEEAEVLMQKIEKEEEHVAYEQPDKKMFHLCIVNLVIGVRQECHRSDRASS